jgi:xanthine dehydrogenase accessory factor
MRDIYRRLLKKLEEGDEAVLVTRIHPRGREKSVHSADFLEKYDPERKRGDSVYLRKDGDDVTIVELFTPGQRMVVFGAGHIAVPLAEMAHLLKFDVVVFDDRPSFAHAERFPHACEVICDYFENAARRLAVRRNDCVVIVTRGHRHDQQCLRAVLGGEMPQYLGMIGSKRRVSVIRRNLAEEGCAEERIRRLHSPIGIDIGAVTPEEIALSILAEIVRENRGASGDSPSSPPGLWRKCSVDPALLAWLAGDDGEAAAVVTVLATKGPTPREAGAKMVVRPDGRIIGSIGGGCAEAEVAREARGVIRNNGFCFRTIDLTGSGEEDGMACGGIMEVLIESCGT